MRSLILACLLAFTGCAGPWTVVRSSSPPALRGASPVSVFIDTSELEIDGMSRDEFEAQVSAQELSEFDSALRSSIANFTSEISSEMSVPIILVHSGSTEGETRMSMRFMSIQRGARGTIGSATSIDLRIDVYDGTEVVDTIELSQSSSATRLRATIPRRMRLCAVALATIAVQYFDTEQTR